MFFPNNLLKGIRRRRKERAGLGLSDSVSEMAERSEATRIMVAVNESSMKGYPHPSISSKGAFEWTMKKIVRDNLTAFNLLFLHVQVPDEDGASLSLSLYFFSVFLFLVD